jgi:hypothetical protein
MTDLDPTLTYFRLQMLTDAITHKSEVKIEYKREGIPEEDGFNGEAVG